MGQVGGKVRNKVNDCFAIHDLYDPFDLFDLLTVLPKNGDEQITIILC